MNPTLIKYGLMALAFVGWTGIVAYGVADYKERGYRAAIAEQKAEAEKTLREANEKTAKENERNAQIARDTDAMYQELINSAYAGRDDFASKLRLARRGQSCGSQSTREAGDPGIGQEPAPSSNDGFGGPDSALTLRDAVISLQVYSKACHSWATQIGR